MRIACLFSTISGALTGKSERLGMVRHRKRLIGEGLIPLSTPRIWWLVLAVSWGCAGILTCTWPLHVVRASSNRGGWAQARIPRNRHSPGEFCHVSLIKQWQNPDPDLRWGRCRSTEWLQTLDLGKKFGGSVFRAPQGSFSSSLSLCSLLPSQW